MVTPADHRSGAFALVKVADHGPANHDAGGGAERLQRPCRDQSADRVGGESGEVCHDREREAREHHRPASEAVGQWSENELRDRHAEQEQRQGQLHGSGVGAERCRSARASRARGY